MLKHVGPGTLVIVPGDREDVILTLTTAHLARRFRIAGAAEAARIAQVAAEATNERTANVEGHEGAAIGLVLTGGYRPRDAVLAAIRQADLFATIVAKDTYIVASEIHDLLVKTHPADVEKIALIKALVAEHLDIERILGGRDGGPRGLSRAAQPIRRPATRARRRRASQRPIRTTCHAAIGGSRHHGQRQPDDRQPDPDRGRRLADPDELAARPGNVVRRRIPALHGRRRGGRAQTAGRWNVTSRLP